MILGRCNAIVQQKRRMKDICVEIHSGLFEVNVVFSMYYIFWVVFLFFVAYG